jgi:hypothetical protein
LSWRTFLTCIPKLKYVPLYANPMKVVDDVEQIYAQIEDKKYVDPLDLNEVTQLFQNRTYRRYITENTINTSIDFYIFSLEEFLSADLLSFFT